MPSPTWSRAISLLAAMFVLSIIALPSQAQIRFDLPAQPLGTSLTAIGTLGNLNVMFDPSVVDGLQAPALKADLSPDEALGKLLSGTKLHAVRVDANTIRVMATARPGSILLDQEKVSPMPKGQRQESGSQEEESGRSFSDGLRLAQLDSGKAEIGGAVEGPENNPFHRHERSLEEIVITGSRLKTPKFEGAQEVRVFSQEDISDSGRSTLSEFLNNLSSVSVNSVDNGMAGGQNSTYGKATVQLHGLPQGTTLVLLDGRRLQSSGLSGAPGETNVFDLNTIPLVAVDRIEVISEGSSAVYGSDAIAGVVNVILKKEYDGLSLAAKHGWADGTHETNVSVVFGKQWDRGGVTFTAGYQRRGALYGYQRSITASQDFRKFGGSDYRSNSCDPGNVYTADGSSLPGALNDETYAAISAGTSANPKVTYGQQNLCSPNAHLTFVPPIKRYGGTFAGRLTLTDHVEAFAQGLVSETKTQIYQGPPTLYNYDSGDGSYVPYIMPASNPYNPFGRPVDVTLAFPNLPALQIDTKSTFYNLVAGLRGELGSVWNWEASGWLSQDNTDTFLWRGPDDPTIFSLLNSTDLATALNPFTPGLNLSSATLSELYDGQYKISNSYKGRTLGITAILRGDVINLPAGPLRFAIGTEALRDTLQFNYAGYIASRSPVSNGDYTRKTISGFVEARVPILGGQEKGGDVLTATIAGREDHYVDFGGKFDPQFGLEFRPLNVLLLRAAYAKAFKAPSLFELESPTQVYTTPIVDPRTGSSYNTTGLSGGNPGLAPESGSSTSFGFVLAGAAIPNLRASATFWRIQEKNSIQLLDAQTIITSESLFPGAVIRDANGTVTQIDQRYTNFGEIDVRGFDYQVQYRMATQVGEFSPSLAVTQTISYKTRLIPGTTEINRTDAAYDDGNWAPRWKGSAAITWRKGPIRTYLAARYVGSYRDYDSTRTIGNTTYVDASVTGDIGSWTRSSPRVLQKFFLSVGAVNLFNRLPQYSGYYFGYYGYDPAQADIRGRFLYVNIGTSL